MFVVVLTYEKPLEVIDTLLEAHIRYLDECYAQGVFLASGPQTPRIGGVILAQVESRETLMKILARDPFNQEGAARYEVIEFVPTKTVPGFALLA